MRVRRICCLNNVGTMPLNSRKDLWNKKDAPFPWQHNSPKRKGGMKESFPRQVDKKSRGSQGERSGILKEEERTNFYFFSSTFLRIV